MRTPPKQQKRESSENGGLNSNEEESGNQPVGHTKNSLLLVRKINPGVFLTLRNRIG